MIFEKFCIKCSRFPSIHTRLNHLRKFLSVQSFGEPQNLVQIPSKTPTTSFHKHPFEMSKCSIGKPFCGAFGIHEKKLRVESVRTILAEKNETWHHIKLPQELSANIKINQVLEVLRNIFTEKKQRFWSLIFRPWRVWKSTKCWKCLGGRSFTDKKDHFKYSFLHLWMSKFWLSIGYHGGVK